MQQLFYLYNPKIQMTKRIMWFTQRTPVFILWNERMTMLDVFDSKMEK